MRGQDSVYQFCRMITRFNFPGNGPTGYRLAG